MRISSQTVNNMATGAMSGAYTNYANIIQKIAQNRNFTKVSENVPDAVSVMKIKNQISELEGYQGNAQHAINEMNLAYDTLDNVSDELNSINSLVVAASNATTTKDAAKAYASEISQRLGTITDLMNTKYLNNYIFAGTFTEERPYSVDDEGNIEYHGSPQEAGDRNLMISKDTKMSYNFTGEEIFGKQDGVSDFFSQMKELVDLLNYDGEDSLDYGAIRDKLNILDTTMHNISQKNGTVSSKVSKLLATKEINEDTITNLTGKKAEIEEVDIVKAASELAAANTGLQASYMVGTNALRSISLMDFI